MKKYFLYALAASLICNCAGNNASSPSASSWTAQQISSTALTCQQQVANQVSDPTKTAAICQCWVNLVTAEYTPQQLNTNSQAVTSQTQSQLSSCASAQGQTLQFDLLSVLRKTLFGSRAPQSEGDETPLALRTVLGRIRPRRTAVSTSTPAAAPAPVAVSQPAPPKIYVAHTAQAPEFTSQPTPAGAHGEVSTAPIVAPTQTQGGRPIAEKYEGYPKDIRDELNRIDGDIQDTESMDDIQFHKAAFNFAFLDPNGLKMQYWHDAKAFADRLSRLPSKVRARKLILLKNAFQYAFKDSKGLKMQYWTDAKDFADKVSDKVDGEKYLIAHKLLFQYAFIDSDGLKMQYWTDAKSFADQIAARTDGLKVLKLHREAFKYAFRDSDGLKMQYWTEAKEYADKASGLLTP